MSGTFARGLRDESGKAFALAKQVGHIGLDQVGRVDAGRVVRRAHAPLLLLEPGEVGLDLVRRTSLRAGLLATLGADDLVLSGSEAGTGVHALGDADRGAEVIGLHLEGGESSLRLFEIPLQPPDAAGGDALTHLLHRRARIVRAIRPAGLDQLAAGVLRPARSRRRGRCAAPRSRSRRRPTGRVPARTS